MARREARAHSETTTKRTRERLDLIGIMLTEDETPLGLNYFRDTAKKTQPGA
jgi:hypothetical protein